jgi:hypothetical protein
LLALHSGGSGSKPGSGHVGFVVDKAALMQVFSEYFGFLCQAFHRLLIIRGWCNRPLVASVIVDSVTIQSKKTLMEKDHLDIALRKSSLLHCGKN